MSNINIILYLMSAVKLLPLVFLIPLSVGLFCTLLSNRLAYILCIASSFIQAAVLFYITNHIINHGSFIYLMGGWEQIIGISWSGDLLSCIMMFLIWLAYISAIICSPILMKGEIRTERINILYALITLCSAGMYGMAVTRDIFNSFVLLEITSLASYTLISISNKKESMYYGFIYLIIGTIGACFFLFGIAMFYINTGALNMHDLKDLLQYLTSSKSVLMGAIFIILGLCLKIAIFPLHLWLVGVYYNSASWISGFIAAISAKMAIYLLIRVTYAVMPWIYSDSLHITTIIKIMAMGSIIIGSYMALKACDIRYILSYSSIAHLGYIMLFYALGTESSIATSVIEIVNHSISKGGLFLITGLLYKYIGSTYRNDWSGLSSKFPIECLVFTILAGSLIGMPFTIGFISKWQMFSTLLSSDHFFLLALIVTTSFISIAYFFRIIEIIYFRKPIDTITKCTIAKRSSFTIIIYGIIALALGIFGNIVVEMAYDAAAL